MNVPKGRWWQKYVPGYARNPFRLAWRLLTEKKPAARSALFMAAAGIAVTPFDALFALKERRIYEQMSKPRRPIVLVCGPPRSGTTLVAQYLINNLDVCYLNNLTSLFPRSPIYANRLLGKWIRNKKGDYEAFYGKSRSLSGSNDALYIWDRWLGSNREIVPDRLDSGPGQQMRQFFAAVEDLYNRPIVNKVNRLNTCANLVAEYLSNVQFVCVMRAPLFLAQSLYVARNEIMGDLSSAYGVEHHPRSSDPVEDVCLQVIFHEHQAQRQLDLLGPKRFSLISYEQFCQNPQGLLEHLSHEHAELTLRVENNPPATSFSVSDKRRLPESIFEQMRECLRELGAGRITGLPL